LRDLGGEREIIYLSSTNVATGGSKVIKEINDIFTYLLITYLLFTYLIFAYLLLIY